MVLCCVWNHPYLADAGGVLADEPAAGPEAARHHAARVRASVPLLLDLAQAALLHGAAAAVAAEVAAEGGPARGVRRAQAVVVARDAAVAAAAVAGPRLRAPVAPADVVAVHKHGWVLWGGKGDREKSAGHRRK